MRLPEFILQNIEPILQEWEDFARSLSPGDEMGVLALRNDAESILRSAVLDMGIAQTDAEQRSKSRGLGGAGGVESDGLDDASAHHGVARFSAGFDINEVVSEYRALRASVLRLWAESKPSPDINHLEDKMRFHESIDQSLAQAVASYSHRVEESRQMFLAILGHDLRSPLSAIKMSTKLLRSYGEADPQYAEVVKIIDESATASARLIHDLIDFASSHLGESITITPTSVDLEHLARDVIGELKASYSDRKIVFDCQGDMNCVCDGPRLRQVLSNLLINALNFGAPDTDVELSMKPDQDDIVFSVRNHGPPIPAELLPSVFDPFVRDLSGDAAKSRRDGSLGLGLYIAYEVVVAHGGDIQVSSTTEDGTVFAVRLPRQAQGSDSTRD